MEELAIGLIVAASIVGVSIYFSTRRPVSSQKAQQSSTSDLDAFLQKQIGTAEERAVSLEKKVATQDTLLYLEDEIDFNRTQLNNLRETRRKRRGDSSAK